MSHTGSARVVCACDVCVLVCACVYVHVGANAHTREQQLWNEPRVSARVDLGSHVGLARRHVQHLGIYSWRIPRFALPAPEHRVQHAPPTHISSTTKMRYSDNCMRKSRAHRPQHAPAHHVVILCSALFFFVVDLSRGTVSLKWNWCHPGIDFPPDLKSRLY